MNIAKLPDLLRKGQPSEGERAKLYAFFGRPKGGPLRVRRPQKCLPQTCIVWGRQGEAVGFRRPAALLYLGCPTAQHAARLLQRNVRFAAAQHSLCIVSRAFWCYASQQGMGKASCLSVSFLTSLPLGLA